jgi:hypothetical protein
MSSAIDQMGFVTIDEVQDAFVYEMNVIQQDLAVNGIPANEKIIIEWIDGIRLQVLKRAQSNLQAYIQNNPHVRQEIREERELKDVGDARLEYLDRVKKNRERAMMGHGD